VFDQPGSSASSLTVPANPVREKSPKRMAPRAPSADSVTRVPMPSSTSGASHTEQSKSFASSVMSTVSLSGSKSGPLTTGLTKPLSIPTAPPRKKHSSQVTLNGDRSRSSTPELKSKDDSSVDLATPSKTTVKTSPFATVGKMWRPMAMAASATSDKDEETYKTYNNFDVLRDLQSEKLPVGPDSRDQVDQVKINGHGQMMYGQAETSHMAPKHGKTFTGKESVSAKSFALLKEKVNANHSNTVKQVLDTVYTSEDFVQATSDVDHLLSELKSTMESLKSSRIDRKPLQFNMCKDELQTQVRQFVTDAKLLVSNATGTREKLAVNMDASMHSLAKIFLHGQATMFMMEAIHQAQHLGSEVIRVANAYKSTLNAAHAAVGKPLADPHMKYLMRQATNLASLLSTLLKSLKSLEQK